MNFELEQEALSSLQEKSKLISYVLNVLTHTSFHIKPEQSELDIYFRGLRGGMLLTIAISNVTTENEADAKERFFNVEYSKWSNALSKFLFADIVTVSATATQLTLRGDTADRIALGITEVAASPSKEFLSPPTNTKSYSAQFTEELGKTLTIAQGLFSNAGSNNSFQLLPEGLMYADRSIVAEFTTPPTGAPNEGAPLHRFLAGFMLLASKFSTAFTLYPDKTMLAWRGDNILALIASEPVTIALPSQEDLDNIRPSRSDSFGQLTIPQNTLASSLSFFNGFYEASAWRPISLRVADGKAAFYYSHPTTQVQKELSTAEVAGASCDLTVSSEALERILVGDDSLVTISYDEESPGVRVFIEGTADAVLSKLQE